MLDFKSFRKNLYAINNENFNDLVLEAFYFQAEHNLIYKSYLKNLNTDKKDIKHIEQIPFLPISFFKSQVVKSGIWPTEFVFESSGTTGTNTSRHYIDDLNFYYEHSLKNFKMFYGNPADFHLLALLPNYLERENSSLVHMVQHMMQKSTSAESGYYLQNYDEIIKKLDIIATEGGSTRRTLLIGTTFALLDIAMQKALRLSDETIVIETGGMKGRRREMIRKEVHSILQDQWQLSAIHSEYGMTELLSQAYALKGGRFKTPPWMKVMVREINDPFGYTSGVGGINVIDLANIHSCVFIETQDIGQINSDGTFEVMGRFDNSDIRGCNLLWS